MNLGKRIAAIGLGLLIVLGSAANAKTCVNPGAILQVPTPGFLKPGNPNADEPNLFMQAGQGGDIPITVVSITRSRLRVMIPATTPYGIKIQIRHRSGDKRSHEGQSHEGHSKPVANAQTCAQPGGGEPEPEPPVTRDLSQVQDYIFERATRNDVAAPSGAPEVVLVGTAKAVSAAEGIVMSSGGNVLRTRLLGNMGLKLTAVDIGGALTLNQLKAELARRAVSVTADRHSVYGAAQGPLAYAGPMVGIEAASPCHLRRSVRVGIIDGPIDSTNPALRGTSIRSFSALNVDDLMGSSDHATGIASLIAGTGQTDLPAGLAQGAEIYSVVAFAKAGGRDVARLENVAAALDWMIGARVQVVNMSLAGPENDTLKEIVRIADESGMIIVAAAGNGGQASLAYPASDDRVIGITAIDAARRLYRKANTGTGLDFAAPGVDVLVADRSGSGVRSGTSYAAAIATAIVAQEASRGVSGRAAVVSALRDGAEDLGDAGPDTRFGWGLIHLGGC